MDEIENRNLSLDSSNGQGLSDSTKRVRVHNTQDQQRHSSCVCPHCGGEHILRFRQAFLALDGYKQKDIVSKAKFCSNSLSQSHTLSWCYKTKDVKFVVKVITSYFTSHSPFRLNRQIIQIISLARISGSAAKSSGAKFRHNIQQLFIHIFWSSKEENSVRNRSDQSTKPDQRTSRSNQCNHQGSEATIVSEHVVQPLLLKRASTCASIVDVG